MRRDAWRSIASRIALSVFESTAESGSSRMRIFGSHTRARASAMRCFCPPESCTPRSPTTVSKPSGQRQRLLEHLRLARRLADLRERVGRVRIVEREPDVARDGRREEEGVLLRVADGGAHRRERELADVDAVHAHGAGRRRQEAGEEHRERRLARARAADDRQRLAGRDPEGDVVEHLARAVREREVRDRERPADVLRRRGADRRRPRAPRRTGRAGERTRRARAARC